MFMYLMYGTNNKILIHSLNTCIDDYIISDSTYVMFLSVTYL